jgi:hypothetical protein
MARRGRVDARYQPIDSAIFSSSFPKIWTVSPRTLVNLIGLHPQDVIEMLLDQLKPNIIVRGPIFPEPVQVIVAIPMGTSVKLVGKGLNTNQVHEPILSAEQLAQLVSSPEKEPFDGDPLRFRLGVEALRLGLACEYDPYFSLSIARVDPLHR